MALRLNDQLGGIALHGDTIAKPMLPFRGEAARQFQPDVVAVPAGSGSKLKTQVARPDPLVAPFTRGQRIGSLKVTAGDSPVVVAEVPLVALEAVEEAGILGRAWDAMRLWSKWAWRRPARPAAHARRPRPGLACELTGRRL